MLLTTKDTKYFVCSSSRTKPNRFTDSPMTNPVAIPKPKEPEQSKAASKPAAIEYYQGNVQLLEARYLQLCSSLRALHRSVEELRDFCKDPNNEPDHVIVEAIFENVTIMRKQRTELVSVVKQMKQLNANTDVPDDIRIMVLGDEKEEAGTEESTEDGLYL